MVESSVISSEAGKGSKVLCKKTVGQLSIRLCWQWVKHTAMMRCPLHHQFQITQEELLELIGNVSLINS